MHIHVDIINNLYLLSSCVLVGADVIRAGSCVVVSVSLELHLFIWLLDLYIYFLLKHTTTTHLLYKICIPNIFSHSQCFFI